MSYPVPARLSRRRQRATVVIVCVATAMPCLDLAVVNSALPFLARDLHSGLSGVQRVLDAYTVALTAGHLGRCPSAGARAGHGGGGPRRHDRRSVRGRPRGRGSTHRLVRVAVGVLRQRPPRGGGAARDASLAARIARSAGSPGGFVTGLHHALVIGGAVSALGAAIVGALIGYSKARVPDTAAAAPREGGQ